VSIDVISEESLRSLTHFRRRESMKKTELTLVSELIRNSRRSDRELAKAVGVSQPTVSRMIKKLEKEGILKEYTTIPDFRKLGFEIMAVTLVALKKEPTQEELKKMERVGKEIEKANPIALLLGMDGAGLGFNRVFVSFHEDYSSYINLRRVVQANADLIDASHVESFIVSLESGEPFQPLTFSTIASFLLTRNEQKKKGV
jgi:DNA-binding Lrp family transcriptional regulator